MKIGAQPTLQTRRIARKSRRLTIEQHVREEDEFEKKGSRAVTIALALVVRVPLAADGYIDDAPSDGCSAGSTYRA